MSGENQGQFRVLAGFAHCFGALSESAYFLCRTNDYYAPEHGRSLAWNNPTVVVDWPLAGDPLLPAKDLAGMPLGACEVFEGL
ncbi:dTDP-4-dehydrorhamnose 3,5-epimerase family protein [Methyloversatilis discipulorum]|uniref:dTDP-4-dehydrorhamnose 3,5-epimerase family protein n=1 Tax=Methyloversatilis discipulorum TaxID=1119528 RepID=UPI0003715102|nr:dTDP-4-dehydrorhamnose 3,5-epimerase family protein [Methyloversatilis discipulorum]